MIKVVLDMFCSQEFVPSVDMFCLAVVFLLNLNGLKRGLSFPVDRSLSKVFMPEGI